MNHYTASIARTFKQDCSAGIKLCLSLDGKFLKVTEVKEDHNHEVSKVSHVLTCMDMHFEEY